MSKEKKVNREEAFQMLRDGMKQVDIANYFECNKSYITQLKKEMLKNEETNNGNGKPKEASIPIIIENHEDHIPTIEKTHYKNQFTHRELELLEIGIDAHIKAYRPKAKSGTSKLAIKDFEDLLIKIGGLIR